MQPLAANSATAAVQNSRSDISANELIRRYNSVRAWSERLCKPLVTEDYVIQSMPDCSPAKWHLAHTSWFFETFILKPNLHGYKSPHPQYEYLFNSYYNSLGARHCRPKRGLISRPTVEDTYVYRAHVDKTLRELIGEMNYRERETVAPLMELGINHEQQHQELIVTDLKHMLSENPLQPTYEEWTRSEATVAVPAMTWSTFEAGVREIGYGGTGFSFDNETPKHPEYVTGFAIADRLVTNGEYMKFMAAGGYERPEFWLSEGWNTVQARAWGAPLYWLPTVNDAWEVFTLHGTVPVDPNEPVCHVSYFEAEAYAHWAGARLATEAEWETASLAVAVNGNFAESGLLHPVPLRDTGAGQGRQMFGDVWEWTRSQYLPYAGYKQADGALGEYNGKFMCNQFVLRGGSCATPQTHIRPTYRNFFPADTRWQFTGIRLAKDL